MADDKKLDVRDFGASFKGFMEQMAQQAPAKEPELLQRARQHFGADRRRFPSSPNSLLATSTRTSTWPSRPTWPSAGGAPSCWA